jgi:hypothetical protein
METLSNVPDLNREDHFLRCNLVAADRAARQVRNLNPSTSKAEELGLDIGGLMRRMSEYSEKISRTRSMLEDLHESRSAGFTRARPVTTQRNTLGSGGRFRGGDA